MSDKAMEYETIVLAKGFESAFSVEFSNFMDSQDSLSHFKNYFIFPKLDNNKNEKNLDDVANGNFVYLCGNSLGLQPKKLQSLVLFQLEKWANEGVEGHFSGIEVYNANYRLPFVTQTLCFIYFSS